MPPNGYSYLQIYLESRLKIISSASALDSIQEDIIPETNPVRLWLLTPPPLFKSISRSSISEEDYKDPITGIPFSIKDLESGAIKRFESSILIPEESLDFTPTQHFRNTEMILPESENYQVVELPTTFFQNEAINSGINRASIGNTTSLLGLGVKDLIGYKEKVITIENLVELTKEDYTDYKLSDFININNFIESETVPLSKFPIPIQNEIGYRFLEFDGYIKSYDSIDRGTQKFFYKDKIARLFKGMPDIMPILYKACTESNIPEVLFVKFNNRIKIDLTKIYIQNDNLIPVMCEISISNRDNILNKDIFIYYNLTNSTSIEIELDPSIRNFVLNITCITLEATFTETSLIQHPELNNQIIKYDSRLNYFYYETFTNLNKIQIPKEYLIFSPIGKKTFLWKIFVDKASNIRLEPVTESFRYQNSSFYIPILDGYNNLILPQVPNQFKFFEEESDVLNSSINSFQQVYYKDMFYAKVEQPSTNNFNIIDTPLIDNIQYAITIVSGYKHCDEFKTLLIDDDYKPLINFIDLTLINSEDFNKLLLAYFYKINRNNKIKKTFIYWTRNLLDIDLNSGKFDKEYNFKNFFMQQFTSYLRTNTDQIPFSGGFKSNIKNFIQTKSFNIDYVVEELVMFLSTLNNYYSTNFQLVSVTPKTEDNGVFVKLTIMVVIKINEEIITLEVVSQ